MGSVGLVPVAVVCAVCVWFGARAAAGLPAASALTAAVGIGWIGAWWLAGRRGPLAALAAAWLVLGGAALARGAAHRERLEAQRERLGPDDLLVRCRVAVVSHPSASPDGPRAVVACESSDAGLPRGTRLHLRFAPSARVSLGQRLTLLARVRRPPGARNPGAGSAQGRWGARGVVGVGRALAARVERAPAWEGPARLRAEVERTLGAALDSASRELVVPLVVGDWSPVTPATASDLRRAGLIHLLALSGLHVSWFASMARGAAALLRLPLAARSCAGAAAALFYCLLAGSMPSLARAAVSELWTTGARLSDRVVDGRQALAGSVVALLAFEPGWIGDAGFQLSCAATAGLVCFSGVARAHLTPRLTKWTGPLLPTLCAQLGALPWLVAHFHAVSVAGFAANLVAVPLSGLLLAAAWLGLGLRAVAAPLAAPCFSAADAVALALRAVTSAAAGWPGAVWTTGHDPAGLALLFAGVALLLVLARPAPTLAQRAAWNPATRVAGGLVALVLTLSGGMLALDAPALRPPPGRLWAVFLDVGQGDACALAFPDGSWWLVDAGPRSPQSDAGESVVVPFLRWAGVRRLEALVVTHADADHAGGAPAVLRALPVGRLWVPAPTARVPGPATMFRNRAQLAVASRGDILREHPPTLALWPPAGEDSMLTSSNRRGLVLRAGRGLLLAADVDSLVERRLDDLNGVTLLKVAHHGSRSSTSAAWLERNAPRWAVISCGPDNRFGHPDPAVLARLGERGIRVWRTDRLHAAWFEEDAGGWKPLGGRHRAPRFDAGTNSPGKALARPLPAQ